MINKKGEGYIDTTISVLIICFILLFSLSMVSLVVTSEKIKTVSYDLAEYAALNGRVDIDDYAEILKERVGLDFIYSFEKTNFILDNTHVQLGDEIICHVSYEYSFVGFGEKFHLATLKADSMSRSQVYWKD